MLKFIRPQLQRGLKYSTRPFGAAIHDLEQQVLSTKDKTTNPLHEISSIQQRLEDFNQNLKSELSKKSQQADQSGNIKELTDKIEMQGYTISSLDCRINGIERFKRQFDNQDKAMKDVIECHVRDLEWTFKEDIKKNVEGVIKEMRYRKDMDRTWKSFLGEDYEKKGNKLIFYGSFISVGSAVATCGFLDALTG